MRALLVGACLAIATPASADAIEIGKPSYGARIERLTVSLWVKEAELVGAFQLDVAGSDEIPREISIPLTLPTGSRATAMELTHDGTTTRASALEAGQARAYYHDTVARSGAPVLLEVRGEAMALHVFPVSTPGTQRIAITVTMPRATRLTVEPRGHTIGRLEVTAAGRTTLTTAFSRVARAQGITLPGADRGLFEQPLARPAVDATTSLVATRPSVSLAPTVSIGPVESSQCNFGGTRMVRKPIKLAQPRLRHCYERELLRDRTLAGVVHTQFLIKRTGTVEVKEVTGTLTDAVVQACVAGVFASLEYPVSDGDTLVNYPLTFRPAD